MTAAVTDFLQLTAQLAVILNVAPLLPLICGMLGGHRPRTQQRVLLIAIGSAVATAAVAIAAAPPLFRLLGIQTADLQIAGGIVLLVFGIHDLLFSRGQRKQQAADEDTEEATELLEGAAVPLGVPIIMGPGGLATLLLAAETAPAGLLYGAMLTNEAINLLLLLAAPAILRLTGESAARAVGKVMSLMLCALSVSMIRAGIGA